MSAGHNYAADGWCRHPRCMRHQDDPVDLCFCPDTVGYRKDLPREKHERKQQERTRAVVNLLGALLRRAMR